MNDKIKIEIDKDMYDYLIEVLPTFKGEAEDINELIRLMFDEFFSAWEH